MNDIRIRPFAEADWPQVWPILRSVAAAGETFTYPADLDTGLARAIWIERPPGLTVVAETGAGEIIGTAKMGRNQMGPGAHVATASFMVGEKSRGYGAGRKLGEHALAWARESGFRAMQFNAVVASNERAVALWRKLGFEIVGTVPEAFHHPSKGYVGLHVMHQYL